MSRDLLPITIKVNVAGSWANLCNCQPACYADVKAACEVLALAHRGPIRFKTLNAVGCEIESYGPIKPSGIYGWVPAS